MKTIFALAAIAFGVCLSGNASAQSNVPPCPTQHGTYFLQGTQWTSMDPVSDAGFKTTGVFMAGFSEGITKAHMKAQFRDSHSPYQLGSDLFAMCLVGVIDTGRNIVVARFQEKKDRRELPLASYRIWTGYNVQLDSNAVVAVAVQKKADSVYLVTSAEPLPDGEYILLTTVPNGAGMFRGRSAASLSGYDFGVHAK